MAGRDDLIRTYGVGELVTGVGIFSQSAPLSSFGPKHLSNILIGTSWVLYNYIQYLYGGYIPLSRPSR
jgi:hypothetical protein